MSLFFHFQEATLEGGGKLGNENLQLEIPFEPFEFLKLIQLLLINFRECSGPFSGGLLPFFESKQNDLHLTSYNRVQRTLQFHENQSFFVVAQNSKALDKFREKLLPILSWINDGDRIVYIAKFHKKIRKQPQQYCETQNDDDDKGCFTNRWYQGFISISKFRASITKAFPIVIDNNNSKEIFNRSPTRKTHKIHFEKNFAWHLKV